MLNVKIKRLTPEAILPTKANEHDAGWDFYAPLDMETVTIFPHERRTIRTGISLAVPIGWYLQIMSRSGMAAKRIDARAGVIDCTYRGEVGIILHNDGAWGEGYVVEPGAKIAQGVFLMVPDVNWEEVDELDETARGDGGYGSSGGISENRDFDKITLGCFVSFNDTATTRKGKRYLVTKKTVDEINFMNGGCLHKVFNHHWVSMGGYICNG